jgi:carbon storage regulator
MLVLSRKVGERILIGDQVTVTVVRITGGGVRLGIEAPPELAVIREELQCEMDKSAEVDGAPRSVPPTAPK